MMEASKLDIASAKYLLANYRPLKLLNLFIKVFKNHREDSEINSEYYFDLVRQVKEEERKRKRISQDYIKELIKFLEEG